MQTLFRLHQVLAVRGKSRSAHYLDIQRGLCTKPVRIGERSVAWPSREIDEINRAQIAGADNEALRQLVQRLHAERKVAP